MSHFAALLFSVAGLVLLIIVALQHGGVKHIVGFTLFGVSLILLYTMSSLYHFLERGTAKRVFQHIDRSMIYVLIAGTYTAMALSLPNHAWGWSLFGVEWGLATLGIVLECINLGYKKYWASALYLLMGWLALIALPVILGALSPTGFILLVGGGILYSLGFVFFALERHIPRVLWFSMHDIFHFFVMAGSFSHFWLAYRYML